MSTVAEFSIEHHQFLNEDNELSPSAPPFAKDFTQLIGLYGIMVLTRLFDGKAVNMQRVGKMGTFPSSYGQEAVFAAIGHCMTADDVLCPYYRDYAAMLQRGVKMSEILNYWGGDERGSNYQAGIEDFPLCVPIATQCLHATGVAFAFKHRSEPRVSLATLGDGATSKGDFYEALNLAGDWQLPTVFVVNNNQWAISVPRSIQTGAETLAQKGIAAGMPVVQVDGNDIIAMVHVLNEAMERARSGKGPTLIEAVTFRLCDHTTADDAKRYIPQDEYDEAKLKEPILRLRNYLHSNGQWDENKEKALLDKCKSDVESSVQEYLATPLQAASDLFDYLYEELPESLSEQRQEALEFAQTQGAAHE